MNTKIKKTSVEQGISFAAFKLDRTIYKNFRAVCACVGDPVVKQLEGIMHEYTVKHAKEATRHLNNMLRRKDPEKIIRRKVQF